jgi:hypothetical protein
MIIIMTDDLTTTPVLKKLKGYGNNNEKKRFFN